MKKVVIYWFSFVLLYLSACNSHKYPVQYVKYRAKKYFPDKNFPYPKDKIKIEFLNDSLGIFKVEKDEKNVFLQKFNYEIKDSCSVIKKCIVIKKLDTTYRNVISLNVNDSLYFFKNNMVYFYMGNRKYVLLFKRKRL